MLKYCLKSIALMFKYSKNIVIIAMTLMIISALMTPLALIFTQRLIDSVLPFLNGQTDIRPVILWGGLLAFTMVFTAANSFMDEFNNVSFKKNLMQRMTPELVEKYKRLDYSCYEDPKTHDILLRIGNQPWERIINIYARFTLIISSSIRLVGVALVFWQVSYFLTIGYLAIQIPMLLLHFRCVKIRFSLWMSQSQKERKLGYMDDLLQNKASLFELKIFSSQAFVKKKWQGAVDEVMHEHIKTNVKANGFELASTLLMSVWSLFVILFLTHEFVGGGILLGAFVALIGSLVSIFQYTRYISYSFGFLSQRSMEIKYYEDFLNLPEVNQQDSAVALQNYDIVFDNVYFTYPNTTAEILKGVSFTLNQSQRVAFVGENGAGKSTIIKLLCGLYQPTSGKISIGGIDLKDLSKSQIRNAIGIVFQDFFNYTLSLRENVGFGDVSRMNDDDRLKSAIRHGLAEEVLQISDKGLDTNLGKLEDDGIDLSGGQWQRVAIARACVADSAFVILDEPTAAMDPVAESQMYNTFSQILKDKGSIMISHRLASAKMAQKIIVLQDGIVSEEGSHDQLMKNNGLYKKMYDTQSVWYKSA